MSTFDPDLVHERRGLPLRVPLLVGLGVLTAGSFAVVGFFFCMDHDIFRQMALNPPQEWDTQAPSAVTSTAMALAGTAGFLAGIVLSRLARAVFSGIAPLLLAPLVALAGLAVGTALFFPHWSAIQSAGQSQSMAPAGSSTFWDLYSWFEYWVPVVLPVGLAVLALLILVAIMIVVGRVRNAVGRLSRLQSTGRKVEGVVSAARFTGAVINGMPSVKVTTRFTDLSGTVRWVVKKGMFPRFAVPQVGDAAVVWFDPADPQNERSIAVEFGNTAQMNLRFDAQKGFSGPPTRGY